MDMGLCGKTVLISASAGGIGLAMAAGFVEEGAQVILNGRQPDELARAEAQLRERHREACIERLVADLSTVDGAERAFSAWPAVDVLVNNLGVYDDKPFFAAPDAQWSRSFEINVVAAARLSRHYLAGMLERGTGRMIFTASEAAIVPVVDLPSYSAAKAAQLSLSRSLAELTRGTAVTVNAVIPGSAATAANLERIARLFPDLPPAEAQRRFMAENQPSSLIGRLISPDEIAALVVFLAGAQSGAINGAALRVDGGILRSIY